MNPSLVPGGAGEQEAAAYILDYFTSLGYFARLDKVEEGRPNVIGLCAASGGSDIFERRHGLILNGHLDTVGTGGMDGEPLEARIEGDRVYGRGGYDMKGGLVMGMLAMAALKRAGVELKKSVLFTGVVDEEYASIGTEDVAERYEADAAVVLEPTNLAVNLAHKGFIWATVETFGRAAHGSRHEEGIDAIAKMGRVLTGVRELGDRYLTEETHPLVGCRSVHASIIEGGTELSTYPNYCKAQFEARTLPGDDPDEVREQLRELCDRLAAGDPDFRSAVSLNFSRNGYEIEREAPVVQALATSYEEVTGRTPEYTGSAAWLDSAVLGEAGIPTVIFGPTGTGAHAAVEYVSLNSVVEGAKVLAQAVFKLCG